MSRSLALPEERCGVGAAADPAPCGPHPGYATSSRLFVSLKTGFAFGSSNGTAGTW